MPTIAATPSATSVQIVATYTGPPTFSSFTFWIFVVGQNIVGGSSAWVAQATQSSGTYTFTGLTSGVQVYFGVTVNTTETPARSSARAIIASTPTVTVPGQVTGLTVTGTTSSAVSLSWNSDPGASSYNIERNGVVIQTGVTITAFTDSPLSASTTYTYNVAGVNIAGIGTYSSSVLATTASSGAGILLYTQLQNQMGVTGKKYSGQHLDYYSGGPGGSTSGYGASLDQLLPLSAATPSNITVNDRSSGNTGLCPAIISFQLNTGGSNSSGTSLAQSIAVCQGVQSAGNILQLGYAPVSPVTSGYAGANGEFPGVITPGNSLYTIMQNRATQYGTAMANLGHQFIFRPFHESNGGVGSYWWAYGSGTSGGAPTLAQFLTLWNQTMAAIAAAMNAAVAGSWNALVLLNWNQNFGNNYNLGFGGSSANYCGPSNIAVPVAPYAPKIASIDYYYWDNYSGQPLAGSGYTQMSSLGIPFFLAETGFSGGTPPTAGTKDLSTCPTTLETAAFNKCFGYAYWAQTFAFDQQNNANTALLASQNRNNLPVFT